MSWADQYKEEKIVVQQEGAHNKFWAAYWDESKGEVKVRWGRIGTSGQSQTKKFRDLYDASSFINQKYNEKRRKGYDNKDKLGRTIDRAVFEEMCVEAAIIGSANKCNSIQWVEITDQNNLTFKTINNDRLFSPDCVPGLLVNLETKKAYDGKHSFVLLFALDKIFDANNKVEIGQSHNLYDMTKKIEEAIGRRFQ